MYTVLRKRKREIDRGVYKVTLCIIPKKAVQTNSDESDLSRTAGGKPLPSDEDEGDDDEEAAHPLKDLFGIRREKVARTGVGIKDEKECGKRHKPYSELLPC